MAIVKRSLRRTIFKITALLGVAVFFAVKMTGLSGVSVADAKTKALDLFSEGRIIKTAHADTPDRDGVHRDGGGGSSDGPPPGSERSSPGTSGDAGSGGASGGDSGGVGCFVGTSLVSMIDGSTKAIAEIKVGDKVMSFSGLGELVSGEVVKVFEHHNKEVVNLNGILVTPEHRFLLTTGEYKRVNELAKGDVLVDQDGVSVSDWSVQPVEGTHTVYNFTVEEHHTYVAQGFRVHNVK